MRKKYNAPFLKIVQCHLKDILTASGVGDVYESDRPWSEENWIKPW